MSLRILGLFLVVAATVGACTAAGVSDPGAGIKLDGTSWKAILVAGQPPVAGREPTATFADARVGGTTGCNSYGGPYTQSGGTIAFGPLISTMMGCEAPIGEVEGRFNTALNGADRVSLDGDGRLVIDGTGGSVTFLAILTTGG